MSAVTLQAVALPMYSQSKQAWHVAQPGRDQLTWDTQLPVHALVFEPPVPYRPAPQAVHASEVVAAGTFPYAPAAHAVHKADVDAATTLP